MKIISGFIGAVFVYFLLTHLNWVIESLTTIGNVKLPPL